MTRKKVTIPELPRGRVLGINLLRSWGDKNYVGIRGIEVFDANGNPVFLHASEEFSKIVNHSMLTCDEMYMWVKQGQSAEIVLDLGQTMQISMIRVWNYNKSRTYASRGVRDMSITLDERADGPSQ